MPIKKEVTIGDCRLILGDCTEIINSLSYDSPDMFVAPPKAMLEQEVFEL